MPYHITCISCSCYHTFRSHKGGYVHVYRLIEAKLVLLHSTAVEDVPLAIVGFGGRALISVGKTLRIYDLGKRKLLRKCENKNLPTTVGVGRYKR